MGKQLEHRTNADRSTDAWRALQTNLHGTAAGEDPKGDIIDLVTNLMHYANEHGIEFDEITSMAKVHFECEVQEEADNG